MADGSPESGCGWKGRVGGGDINCANTAQHSTAACTMSFFSSPRIYRVNSGCNPSDARGMLYRNRICIRVKALFLPMHEYHRKGGGLTSSGASVLYCAVPLQLIRVCLLCVECESIKKYSSINIVG